MKIAITAGRVVLFAALCAVLGIPASSLFAQGALDQLEDGTNTGTLFDGSDGERFGTDTGIGGSSGNIPDVPEPTPVDSPDDSGSDQGGSDDSGGDQGGSDDSGDDSTGKDGEEPAE